ncbi:two-component sensor histidine kinase [Planobispora takensis]|uniref:Oxygen sensor histidine kinase NreB n=1 Tax=Planobispora takensis TaxID=1367882 RepID=A0A8J3T2E4_9ACTN|nr:two-component sensor histidine kinase [Planobispora takensis]
MRQLISNAEEILDDVVMALSEGRVPTEASISRLAWDIGADRAEAGIHPKESLDAASIFFRVALPSLSEALMPFPDFVRLFNIVAMSLEHSISARIRTASASYTGFLLNRLHNVQVEERHRIARELHDRIGHGISVAHQQLELHEYNLLAEPARASGNVKLAERAIQETMRNLRQVTSELYPNEPLKSLEKALLGYLDTVDTRETAVGLHINGDEAWASPEVRDESFLIFREALRNALGHARASAVLIRIDIAPHEMRGIVQDNGCGFSGKESASSGMGLRSMRERAELLGGSVVVSSEPGKGTSVEFHVPMATS